MNRKDTSSVSCTIKDKCVFTPILVAAELPLIFILNWFNSYVLFDCNDSENNHKNNR